MTTPTPPYWRLPLQGRDVDLARVMQVLKLPDIDVFADSGGFYLVALEFEQFGEIDPNAVSAAGEHLLGLLNGAGALHLAGFQNLALGFPQRVNALGKIIAYMSGSGTLSLSASANFSATHTAADGTVTDIEPAEPHFTKAIRCAVSEPDFGLVLGLIEQPSWPVLYVVHEIMQRALGAHYLEVIQKSRNEVDRFTQTANATARHDPKKFKPHKNPMTHDEATRFIRQNVVTWLRTLP